MNFFNELQNDISTVNKFYAEQEELYLKQTNLLVAKVCCVWSLLCLLGAHVR